MTPTATGKRGNGWWELWSTCPPLCAVMAILGILGGIPLHSVAPIHPGRLRQMTAEGQQDRSPFPELVARWHRFQGSG